ncbi:alpha-tubulin N-acetyltransferase 1 isoform X2 [Teleopsis dalmanni]|uniref:alpha-tubulin N-acetyltransferase 1 isoform X2 n=1 Tax=Teleopsis dalmanni TaxID=139649 RepID=UPI0018CF1460|nr:alpha-tubulin N-acetyltransferase 1 isoform X2 [Teleopsis dalmanni]XP_037934614.1 alpha-tubulin N-acetyltransferase 1 isoform X2 [Teleopsis dalmanni]
MVEFRFDIKPLFQQSIIKISSNLLPHTFRAADRRQVLDATSKISEIIDRLGQLSAVSQKLSKPVTTAQRLRMSENQVIYLMADVDAGHNGAVLGLLKVGTKDLYLFDESGQTKKVESAPCILDFYIHESRQRAGLGKVLFETMLTEENWQPVKCSVDRPSEKLLAFLRKHYGLINTIPQANNFVLYVGFFDEQNGVDGAGSQHTNGMHVTNSPNTQLFGAHFGDESVRRVRQPERANSAMQVTQISPVGRYGARRPLCSMAEIIHNTPAKRDGNEEPGSSTNLIDVIKDVTDSIQNLQTATEEEQSRATIVEAFIETPVQQNTFNETETASEIISTIVEEKLEDPIIIQTISATKNPTPSVTGSDPKHDLRKSTTAFQLSKQHTGMKNISSGVGMAVTPTNKMEFDQETREDFGIVKINRPIGKITSPNPDNIDAISTVSSTGEGLTEQGYYDLKFYHNKLW